MENIQSVTQNSAKMETTISTTNKFTWFGIFISLFSITALSLVFKSLFGAQLTNAQMVSKELIILGVVGYLIWYILPRENQKLASIGLHNRHWGKSLLWALLITIVCIAAALGCIEICKLLGWRIGESKAFDNLSLPVIALVTMRAGIAEEVFTRGYLLERLTVITGKKGLAFLLSTIPFGLLHYSQGYAGILIATVLGGIFALFYFWKKDLKANIIAHFLVDFIPNVLFPLLS